MLPEEEVMEMESGDDDLVVIEGAGGKEEVIDLSKMTPEERDKLKQHVSSTRGVFTAADFKKMCRLMQQTIFKKN
jgi:hypothetical protein